MLADERLDALRIEVADRHDSPAVGTVEVTVEVAQALRGNCLQHLGQPNRQTIRILRLTEERPHLRSLHSRARPLVAAPLLDHDATLAVDFGRLERDAAGEIAERIEPAHQSI